MPTGLVALLGYIAVFAKLAAELAERGWTWARGQAYEYGANRCW